MSDRIFNVALAGYGLAGKVFHAPLISATPGLALKTVVSSDPAKVLADWPNVRVAASVDEALSDAQVDLVVIATPDEFHAPQSLAALKAGKAVVVDKPFAPSLDEAAQVADYAKDHGLVLSVFHNRRWDGDFLTVRRLIQDGWLGEVMEFYSAFNRFRPQPRDVWKERREGGVLQDIGPHLIDQALMLFGEPLGVYADLAVQKPGGAAPDYAHVILRYEKLRAILHCGQMTPDPGPRFAVHGTLGSYVKRDLDGQEAALRDGQRPGGPGWGAETSPGLLTPAVDSASDKPRAFPGEAGSYPAFYAALARHMDGQGPNPVPPEEALLVMRVLEAARKSAAQRREIELSRP